MPIERIPYIQYYLIQTSLNKNKSNSVLFKQPILKLLVTLLTIQFLIASLGLSGGISTNNLDKVFAANTTNTLPICFSGAGILIATNVTFFDSCTIPKIIHVGDKFIVTSTVINGLNIPIKINALGCKSPMTVNFDKNVFTPINPGLVCFNPNLVEDILQPHQKIQYSSPYFGNYTAISSGNTTAKLSLTYQIQNGTNDTQFDKMEPLITHTQLFSFNIEKNNITKIR